jgi:hypothetical protein
MDIKARAKKFRELLFLPRPGEAWVSVWRRQREARSWKFWHVFVLAMKAEICAVIKASLNFTWSAALVSVALLTYFFESHDSFDVCTTVKVEPLKPEVSRGPPKRFIPIPDAEIGGCARSDSLIHSLVF